MGLKHGLQQPGFDFAQPTGFLRKYFNPVSSRGGRSRRSRNRVSS